MIRIIIRDLEPLWPVVHLRLPIVRMSKIFHIKPYAIATPDAHLRCGANPNVTHYTIFKTLLDKLLYSKMLEPKSLAAVSPPDRGTDSSRGLLHSILEDWRRR